ncbi:MAG: acylphosphatase [Candidatus Nitrohelix vancouverensis]|uniref:acylphosphatase n=1 Tax=Candidatus Nitrohelix vancouverensis TaxID=2705534 RepID=A0A7T0C1N9_9BACT|nr:MAG: acylphosphatase [Candidatus Nitrohelix vancouverensis]
MTAVHLVIRGRVQGVSYRASAEGKANELGLKGWVRNQSDGSVELFAEGERSALDALIRWCQQGPPAANVADLSANWTEPQGLTDFKIR